MQVERETGFIQWKAADERVTRKNLPRTQGQPHESGANTGWSRKSKDLSVREGLAGYQLVGGVKAYQDYDGYLV